MYLKWAFHFCISIENFIFPQRKLGGSVVWPWGGGPPDPPPPPPWISTSLALPSYGDTASSLMVKRLGHMPDMPVRCLGWCWCTQAGKVLCILGLGSPVLSLLCDLRLFKDVCVHGSGERTGAVLWVRVECPAAHRCSIRPVWRLLPCWRSQTLHMPSFHDTGMCWKG